MASRQIHWDTIDPYLRGPYRSQGDRTSIPFEVPSQLPGGFRFCRIVSGKGWPPQLPRIDRIAPVPEFDRPETLHGIDGEPVVLSVETPGEPPHPLVVKRGTERVDWQMDPAEWIRGLLAEDYVSGWTRPITSRIPFLNYSNLPHALKGVLQILQSPASQRQPNPVSFPFVPFDDFVEALRKLCLSLACGGAPTIDNLWPKGSQAAVTITHDVDTDWIFKERNASWLRQIVEAESRLGFTGAWYVVAKKLRMSKHAKAIEYLRGAGYEIGSHGWNHDSKLQYLSASIQAKRIARSQHLDGLNAEGIRTPWYCRSRQLFSVLSRYFAYDCSVPNSSAFFSTPCNSGCCTIFPYQPWDGLHELPMTLPPDSFADLSEGYASLKRIAERIIASSGVVVITLHPQPHQSANAEGLRHFISLLTHLRKDYGERLWCATPRDIVRRYQRQVGDPHRPDDPAIRQ